MEQNPTTGPGTRLPRLFSRPLALVVEPDPAAAEIAMGMLDLLGYDLERVTTGAAALEAIADWRSVVIDNRRARRLADKNTPDLARRWHFRMNLGLDSFEELFRKAAS